MKSDSVADLRIFHGVVSVVGTMEGIGRPISSGMDLFMHLVVELLDAKTRHEWDNLLGKFRAAVVRGPSGVPAEAADDTGGASRRKGRVVKRRQIEPCRACELCSRPEDRSPVGAVHFEGRTISWSDTSGSQPRNDGRR